VARDCRAPGVREARGGNVGEGNPPSDDEPEPEVEAGARPSLAEGLPRTQPSRAGTAPPCAGAVVVGLGLRSALSAPPCGLRRAERRPRPTTGFNHDTNYNQNKKKKP